MLIGARDPMLCPSRVVFRYNCQCQVGPSCGWSGWKAGSEQTRCLLHHPGRPLSVWEKVCSSFGFQHIKRVEVVTSHPGCRNQGWYGKPLFESSTEGLRFKTLGRIQEMKIGEIVWGLEVLEYYPGFKTWVEIRNPQRKSAPCATARAPWPR